VKKKSPPYAIIGAVVLGFICIFLFFQWKKTQDAAMADAAAKQAAAEQALKDAQNVPPPPPPAAANTRNVYYATQPVEAGVKLSPAFFEKKATPVDILPDAYSDQNDVVGFYAIRKIEKGDPLTPRNIGKTLPFAEVRISPGMRTVSLPIFNADANFTGGFVIDGDRVDLLFTTFTADNSTPLRTELAMQNVSVFYVPGPPIKTEKSDGLTPFPPPGAPISVTFEVSPEAAQALVFMSQVKNGHFSMILKARSEKGDIKIKPFIGADYYGNIQKIQKIVIKSDARVDDLAKEIAEQEKNQAPQGNTNETPTPTPPTP
jgi:Flp pilus assembly protein CpaB